MKEIPAVLNNSLGFNLHRAYLLLKRDFTEILAGVDLTTQQWQIMNVLWDSDETLNQTDITHLTLKDKQNVSRIIKRLQDKGWIEKVMDPKDNRAFLIQITPKGQHFKEQVLSHFYSKIDRDWGLNDDERIQLMLLLKKVRTHLGDP